MNGSELAQIEPAAPTELTVWSDDFLRTAAIAGQLSRTAFVPESLRVYRDRSRTQIDLEGTAAQVAAAILTGRELGMSPMSALRSIDVIQGVPALRAIALRAVLLAHGHEIWVEEATNTRATVAGRRAGSEHVQRLSWTMDDARSRNLAGKPNWRSQPRNMLVARCSADVARLIAADALLGVPYVSEELEDGDLTGVGQIDAPPPAGPRKARRQQVPAPTMPRPTEDVPPIFDEPARVQRRPGDRGGPGIEPGTQPLAAPIEGPAVPVDSSSDVVPEAVPAEAELVDDGQLAMDVDVPADPPGAGPMTEAQNRMLQVLFRRAEFVDRDDRLAYVDSVLDEPVASSNDLTTDQASRLIDALQTLLRNEDQPAP